MRRRLSLLRLCTASLVLVVGGWALLRLTPLAEWSFLPLLDFVGPWLYLPLPLLALWALLRRDRPAGLWLAAAAALFAVTWGPLLLAAGAGDPVGRAGIAETASPLASGDAPLVGLPIRMLTANLLFTNTRAAAMAEALRAQQADVIAVQELAAHQAVTLVEALRAEYPHQALYPRDGDPWGTGVFSRYAIVSQTPLEIERDTCWCQELQLDVHGRPARLLNAHPPPPSIRGRRWGSLHVPGFNFEHQVDAWDRLLARVPGEDPLLLLADLNLSDRQPAYQQFAARLADTYRAVGPGMGASYPSAIGWQGWGIGWPLPPLYRIDYVWHDVHWLPRRAWTGVLPGSDHYFVAADLELR